MKPGTTWSWSAGPCPSSLPPVANFTPVETTGEMHTACLNHFARCDGVIGAAAVCDYRLRQRPTGKIAKTGTPLVLELVETADILGELGRRKEGRWIVGFALESQNPHENAFRKLKSNGCDAIVLNQPSAIGAESTRVELIDSRGLTVATWDAGKIEIARNLITWIGVNLGKSRA